MARSRIVNLANFEQFTAIDVLMDPGHIGGPKVIPNCVEVSLRWGLGDTRIAVNVLHATIPGSFSPTTPIANALVTGLTSGAAWTALAGFLATTASFAGISLRDLRSKDLPIVGSGIGGPAGTSASTEMPDEVAAVVTLRTIKVGPGNRGRFYVPGWASNAVGTGNVIAAGAVTALQNWADTIPTVMASQGMTFALGQVERAAYTGSTGTAHDHRDAGTLTITAQTVRDNHWDTQRRRGLK
jgi:hypothetical protein